MIDIIIIGAGPGGISAAIYAKRAGYNVLLIEKDAPCSKLMTIKKIENYPGISSISGIDLAMSFFNQMNYLKIDLVTDTVTKVIKEDELFTVCCMNKTYQSKYVILASGIAFKSMDKYNKYIGKNLSTCVTCDGYFYKDKIVGYIGSNNEEIEYLKNLCKEVIVCDNETIINGNDNIESITINNKTIQVDGLFVEKSLTISSIDVPGLEYEGTFVKTNNQKETNIKNLFAVGDVSNNLLKQIITACYDGVMAATTIVKNK